MIYIFYVYITCGIAYSWYANPGDEDNDWIDVLGTLLTCIFFIIFWLPISVFLYFSNNKF